MDLIPLTDLQTLSSPGLIIDASRVAENTREMVRIAGSVTRLRPHLKTHKMREVVDRQIRSGITKFKAATIAEADLACAAGAADVLLAHQPVGPKTEDRSAGRSA